MTRKKPHRRTIEVTVKMPDPGLSRRELNELKKAFKNKLVSIMDDVVCAAPKMASQPKVAAPKVARNPKATTIGVRKHKSISR
jgi:capsular polysaccharide biosynthesis protein